MISFFNKIGNTWIAKFIFALLGISMMAFWGLGGISNTVSRNQTAIEVGDKSLSMHALATAFDTERTKLSQLIGQYVSPQKAIEMGLLDQVILTQTKKLLEQKIREDFGLAASDAAVRKYVERNPIFQDPTTKQFDRALFYTYLTQMKLTETMLAEQLREELASQHLRLALKMVAPKNPKLAEMMWQRQNEKRDIEALLIEQASIALNEQPTEDELKDYYEAYIDQFSQPETRDVVVLSLSPTAVANTIQISDEELQDIYNEQGASYVTPEKRHLYQIRFTSKEKADEALKTVTVANFTTAAKDYGQTDEETDFGFVAKDGISSELAEAAFAAQPKTVLGPVETETGWHLLLVKEIQAAKTPDKGKIYAELRKKLVAERTYDLLYHKAQQLEDLLGEGQALDAAAKQLGVQTQSAKDVDMAGNNLPAEFKSQELIQRLFLLKEGESTPLVENKDGYLIAEVNAIHPVHPKDFSVVRTDVKKIWQTEQQKTKLSEMTATALEQMKKGSIPAKLGQIVLEKNITRESSKSLPKEAIEQIFNQRTGYENATAISLPKASLISVVKKVHYPTMSKDLLPEQLEKLAAQNADMLYDIILAGYADRSGVKVHHERIQKAFSIYQTE